MIDKQTISLLIFCFVTFISARCPQPKNLPIKYDSRHFLCARVYEHSHYVENLSCGGRHRDIYNGESRGWLGRQWNDKVSSLVVRPGCRLDVYEHIHYKGRRKRFTGKENRLKKYSWEESWWRTRSWNNRISSWSCSCDFSNKALTCKPRQEYHKITGCHNPNQGSMQCQHSVQVGLNIGGSVTRNKRVSSVIEASMGAVFKNIFRIGLKASHTTTYNWGKSSDRAFNKMTTMSVSCDVPPGRSVKLLEVIGRCGDTTVYTGYYKCD